ncbi:hypothetical protein LVJ94_34365 [Pendulispora rubella]|uniref:Ketosynthase family 3 (KS3) domain-containing protein n=1 Tax=Pendulispora rubella TaxID=2741070 RepID=A0ABZ2KTK0_9BACT
MQPPDSVKGRRAVVTGMGFCLPGPDRRLCRTKEQFWDIISNARICLGLDGRYYGQIFQSVADFQQWFPEISSRHAANYSRVHFYGLTAMQEAANDAGFDWRAGDLSHAAVLTAKVSIESSVNSYLEGVEADPATITPEDARRLFVRLGISSPPTDVANVQAALLRTDGPTFNVACGCASSNVLLGIARNLIVSGEVDVAVVTGADWFDLARADHFYELAAVAERVPERPREGATPPRTAFRFDSQMRPYDERANCYNMGEGAVTLVLESEEHALRRGAAIYGEILAQATARSALPSAMALDMYGSGIVSAAQRCVARRVPWDRIGYVNGGAEGDKLFNIVESHAMRTLFGEHAQHPLVSSQEACFGHSGSPLGNIGAAATLLMMQRQRICPTAGCEQPDPILPFDPVAGTTCRPHDFDYALSLNYQVGGVATALLLGRYDAPSSPPRHP